MTMNKQKILNMIGLAQKAGFTVIGEERVVDAIRNNTAKIVFLASDTGKNTTKKINDKSSFYKVDLFDIFTTSEISSAVGKKNRKVVGINDEGFKNAITKLLNKTV